MAESMTIILFLLAFIIFLALGMNIATSLFASGIIGLILIEGARAFDVLSGVVGSDIYFAISTYSLSIIPLYILMAQVLMKGNIVEDLFVVIYKISGKRRFVLGAGSIVLGGFLGAVTGSGAAISAALATTTAPELHTYGYPKTFAVSIGAAGGSLAAIIPPSIIIMIYGSLTEMSIGRLFIGSIIPGFLTILVYILVLYCYEKFSKDIKEKKQTIEDSSVVSHVDQLVDVNLRKSIPAFIFVLILMFFIFGGIYGGVVTAGEAGGVGALVSIVGMLVMRRITISQIMDSLSGSARITAMIMMIVMGAQLFGRYMSYARIPRMLLQTVEPIMDNTPLLVTMLLLMLFLFGMFIESAAVMVMSVPVLLPILIESQMDFIWFGVMACLVISLGLLTPPLGLSVYTAAGASGLPVEHIFRYTFIYAMVAAVILIPLFIIFPEIITYLPSLM